MGNSIADLQFCLLHDLPVGFRCELAQLEELAGFVVHSNLPVHERKLVGSPLLIQRLIGTRNSCTQRIIYILEKQSPITYRQVKETNPPPKYPPT